MSSMTVERSNHFETPYHDMIEALKLVRDSRILPRPTPLYNTGELMGRMNRLYIKDETGNPTGAFKLRGAWVAMSCLSPRERYHGVVTASAGNHAQGVAMAASLLGVHADIFIPASAPECKRRQTAELGGEMVTLHELPYDGFDAALAMAMRHSSEHNMTLIHPYDDRRVILGQSTIGSEVAAQLADKALLGLPGVTEDASRATHFLPVGGGGLAAGYAMALKHRYPGSRIVGVQLHGADSAAQSWRTGRRVAVDNPSTLADGTAVSSVGEQTLELLCRYIDDFVVVDAAELGEAYWHELNRRNQLAPVAGIDTLADIPETAAMLSYAGALKFARYDDQADAPWIVVQTGRNADWSKIEEATDAYAARGVNVTKRLHAGGVVRAAVSQNRRDVSVRTTQIVDKPI